MFRLLVPSHSPWSACSKFALITFVCLAIVHCLPVNIQVATAAGLILARATLKLYSLMFFGSGDVRPFPSKSRFQSHIGCMCTLYHYGWPVCAFQLQPHSWT